VNDVVERHELLLPEPALALGALLGVQVPEVAGADGLPLLWHWIYLLDRPAQADLGPDGHPIRGVLAAPPGPGYRRMWAGGRVRTSGVLRCGELATRRSRVLSVQHKQGRSGALMFVAVGHEISQGDRVVVDEQQDIVYREASQAAGQPPARGATGAVVAAAEGEWAIEISPILLFRFSALTYNAHRIHYDRDYARDVEGYPGLLTHGPLQAVAMAEAARGLGCRGDLDFQYRLESPLFDNEGLVVKAVRDGETTTTAARDIRGRQTASGTLRSLDR
jgi:3-methylfumaryl-CoA hydratase